MIDAERALRQQIIDTCRQLEARGLNQGTSGNVSVRCGADAAAGFFLTPTSLPYDRMVPEDVVHVTLDGRLNYQKQNRRHSRAAGPVNSISKFNSSRQP